MAKSNALELSIRIAGKVDSSLSKAIKTAQNQTSGLARGIGEFAEVFCSANYSKKDAAFTVLRTLAASFSGILVKNSMGLPVARAASAQEYTKKFFMFAE